MIASDASSPFLAEGRQTPVVPAAELGREQRFYVRLRNQETLALLDEAYVTFVVE